jgi:hypothetical protein
VVQEDTNPGDGIDGDVSVEGAIGGVSSESNF